MANCYRCGRPILDTRYHLRRRVKTGEHDRRRFTSPKARIVQTHYGMRVVCTNCAAIIDREEGRLWRNGHIHVLLVLLFMVLFLLFFR